MPRLSFLVFTIGVTISLFIPAVSRAEAGLSSEQIKASTIKIQNFSQDYDYGAPWNLKDVETSYGTGFFIGRKMLITNAHVVAQSRLLRVQRNEGTKWYKARIVHIAHDCDLAMITVDDDSFFTGMQSIPIAGLPRLNTEVAVYGFPVGGDKLSITIGVVSRIEAQEYAHSEVDSHLAIQVDAAINSGNSGGPVLQNGRLIGVAFQSFVNAENTGYVIPTQVVEHFLNDIKDGVYDGYVDIGIMTLPLENPSLKEYYGLTKEHSGVVVIGTIPGSGAEGVVQDGDIVTHINDFPIADNGTIQWSDGSRMHYTSIVEEKYKDDIIKLGVIRQGKKLQASIRLKPLDILKFQRNNFENLPRFFIEAGLLFQPLTKNVIETGGRNWSSHKRSLQVYLYSNFIRDKIYKDRREFVVLYTVLPDEINTYYNGYKGLIVNKFNGMPVNSLEHLAELWSKAEGEFIRLNFFMYSTPLVLKRDSIWAANRRIAKRYQVRANRQLQEKADNVK